MCSWKSIKDFDLFLFDFDGLLVDTEQLHYQAYVLMCKQYGIVLDWNFAKFCEIAHANASAIREALYVQFPELQAYAWDILYKEKKKAYMELLTSHSLQLMPGAYSLLTKLQKLGMRCAVATHSPKEHIDAIKQQFPILETIPHWITREDYENPKPAPDAYLTAINRAGRAGDRIIGFEDSKRGFVALRQTKATAVLISSVPPQELPVDSFHFASLQEYVDIAG